MIRAGIIGGAGYTAGELIRLLLAHPQARIVFVHSTSNAGNRLADVHGGLEGDTEMRFERRIRPRRPSTCCSSVRHTARAANGWRRTRCPQA